MREGVGEMSPDQQPEQTRDLRGYLAVVRLRKWTILVILALTIGLALIFSFLQTPIYESTARILVKPNNQSVQQSTPIEDLVDMDTEKELVQTTAVARLAAEQIGDETSLKDLLEHLRVEVPTDTQLLDIAFVAQDPRRAQAGAQAFAQAYITFKTRQALVDIENARAAIQERIDELETQVENAQRDLAGADPGSLEEQQAQSLMDQLTSAIVSARLALPSLEVNPSQIVEAAILPGVSASPKHILNGALALFVGLALGIGLAFLQERIDDRLRGRGDLEVTAGVPVLAVIPKVTTWKKREDSRLVILDEPKSAPSEAYRTLRTGVLFETRRTGVRTLMISGAGVGEGKSTITANLAVSMAQADKGVILVSADLRSPRIHRFFGVSNRTGLVNVLAGEVRASEVMAKAEGVDGLWVLPSGPIPGNPPEMLGSEGMGELLAELREMCDLVLFDTPPLLVVSDALALVPLIDGVLFVANAETTHRGAIMQAREQLEQLGGNVIGAVLNNVDPSSSYYQYHHEYQHESERRSAERREGLWRGIRSTRTNVG